MRASQFQLNAQFSLGVGIVAHALWLEALRSEAVHKGLLH